MTWIAKMMAIAWVEAEERRSWGFTAGALLALLFMIGWAVTSRQQSHSWGHGAYQILGCILLVPVLVAMLRLVLDDVLVDGSAEDLALTLPLWLLLLAAAVGGLAQHDSWLGYVALGVCSASSLALHWADLRWFRHRARIAEQVARGRLLTDPWDAEWYGKLADALLAQGKRDEALKALQRWRVRDPWSCEPQRRIARLRTQQTSRLGRPALALVLLAILGVGAVALAAGACEGVARDLFGFFFYQPCGLRA